MLGLRFCVRAFSSCSKWGPLFIAVRGPLTITASLAVELRLQTHRLSSCGSRAQLLRGMWDLPRPGLEPVFPALAGRLSTTAPPGKSSDAFFISRSCDRAVIRLAHKVRGLIVNQLPLTNSVKNLGKFLNLSKPYVSVKEGEETNLEKLF